jgi:hypothetical protein
MHVIDLEGNQVDALRNEESYAAMTTFNKSKYIVAADVKANVILYEFDAVSK